MSNFSVKLIRIEGGIKSFCQIIWEMNLAWEVGTIYEKDIKFYTEG